MTKHTMLAATILVTLSSALLLVTPASAQDMDAPNTLTPEDRADGWTLLFDGKTAEGGRPRLHEADARRARRRVPGPHMD